MTYRARQGIDPAGVSLAVVVQPMVPAEAAGVMFTANPANGRRDEVMISAAWGLGEAVVGGLVDTDTPGRGQGGRPGPLPEHRRQVHADRVRRRTAPTEQPVPDDRRAAAVLDDAAAARAGRAGRAGRAALRRAAGHRVGPDGSGFVLLQARPITALPAPEADRPTDWMVPDPKALYFRASIVEQLPDPLSPLFADLVGGSVTRSIQALIRELLGRDALRDGDVDLPTVNGYAYYRYSRRGMLRLMWPARRPSLPVQARHGAEDRWRDGAPPLPARPWRAGRTRPVTELTAAELLAGVPSCSTPAPSTTPRCRRSSRSPRPARSSSPGFYDLVRRAGDPPARLPARLGQPADPGREVAVRPGARGRASSRTGALLLTSAATSTALDAAAPAECDRSLGVATGSQDASRRTTATPSTTSTSSTPCRPTTRPR